MTGRLLAVLLVVASGAIAEDDFPAQVRARLNAERWEEALAMLAPAIERDPSDGVLRRLEAEAHRGVARDLQRAQGYHAAIGYLEPRLNHAVTAWAYARTCLWAGEERRGIEHLRASGLPPGDAVPGELELLAQLRRYDEAARRAALLETVDAEWARGWVTWAREAAERRDRLEGRAARAGWIAAGAALVFGLAALAVARVTRRLPAAPA